MEQKKKEQDKTTDGKPHSRDYRGHWRCLQWMIAYAFLIWFAFYTYNCVDWNPGMPRQKGVLRSIGSSQLAYQDNNPQHVYGSFKALQDNEYIALGYSLGNMIRDYSITWEINNISTVQSEDYPFGIISTFTVVAYPTARNLETYAITEDQVVRVYNPPESDVDSIYHWDPIL